MDLACLIERHAAHAPGRTALRFEGGTLTYAALAERVRACAGALAGLGVGHGDRVAVLSLNRPDYLVLLYACARLGAILMPLNWRLAAPELAYILADSGARLLVLDPAFAELAAPLCAEAPARPVVALGPGLDAAALDDLVAAAAPVAAGPAGEGDPLLLVYTSGTTGRPKGAVLTQGALHWNGAMSQHMHAMTARDHVLTVLPFFHVGGLNIQTTPALHLGGCVTIMARFSAAETLAEIAAARPTLTVLVPATIQALLADPGWGAADLSSLRAVATGSSIVPQPLIDAVEARGVPVLQVYGLTESCPIAVYTSLDGDRSHRGSTGQAGLHCEMRVADEAGQPLPPGTAGEIRLRGRGLFAGYWNDPTATAEAVDGEGWFRTGDIGTADAEGRLWVHDRKKNMIISGGENVYPAEVERVLAAHPAVAEAAVIGRPDSRWGEVPVAHVVLREGRDATADEIVAHARAELARFKVPREVVFAESLPKSALGKVQHFRLKRG